MLYHTPPTHTHTHFEDLLRERASNRRCRPWCDEPLLGHECELRLAKIELHLSVLEDDGGEERLAFELSSNSE